jgi:hypothetical protein
MQDAARAAQLTPRTFPSVEWFQAVAERMAAQPEKYRRLGAMDLTLVPRIRFADGRVERYRLRFVGHRCAAVARVAVEGEVEGPHAVVLDGEYAAWREMVENVRRHGAADLTHTLNYLTLPDWPFRLEADDADEGQLDVDRFYRYAESLQEFFDEAAAIETEFVPDEG